MKPELQKKIEETLNSLDGLQRAEANPFLAARIRHRLSETGQKSILPAQWSWRLAVIMVIFALLNIITIRSVMNDKKENSGASAVASDYSISLPQAY
jgi:hypothetical protein